VELDQLQDDVTDGEKGNALLVLRQAESCPGLGPGLYLQCHAGYQAERVLEELQGSLQAGHRDADVMESHVDSHWLLRFEKVAAAGPTI
jgi:hypothetical protein